MGSTPDVQDVLAAPVVWSPQTCRRCRRERHRLHELAARPPGGPGFTDYDELWHWSVTEPEAFRGAVWDFYGISSTTPYDVVALEEDLEPVEISWGQLRGQVGAMAAALTGLGVGPGDRVAGYLPNIPAAVVAMLATASLGAVWTACASDFGARSVLDRLGQTEPTVLVAADGYRYNGRDYDRRDTVAELLAGLPTVHRAILVRALHPQEPAPAGIRDPLPYDEVVAEPSKPAPVEVNFDHPL